MSENRPHVEIYTDGGCDPNPGPGGWGAILIHTKGTKELSGGNPDTTNNRMELTAAVEALRALTQPCVVDLYTDSQYLKKGITEWIGAWKRNGWRKSGPNPEPVANADLWQELDAMRQQHEVNWHWVRGHRGNVYNERADVLATQARPRVEQQQSDPDTARVTLRISGTGAKGAFGWAASVVRGDQADYFQGGNPNSTPNHFTLIAVLSLLEQLPPDEPIQFFTNNAYLYNGITNWVDGWRKKGWVKPEKFREEWQALDRLNRERKITWLMLRDEESGEFAALGPLVEQARQSAQKKG